jgi:hypothetical protein
LKRFHFDQFKKSIKINSHLLYEEQMTLECGFPDSKKSTYELFAVIVHKGKEPKQGHYYCYIKIKKNWWKFDDAKVTPVKPEKVFQENFGDNDQTYSTAYMLVYVRSTKKDEVSVESANKDLVSTTDTKQIAPKTDSKLLIGLPQINQEELDQSIASSAEKLPVPGSQDVEQQKIKPVNQNTFQKFTEPALDSHTTFTVLVRNLHYNTTTADIRKKFISYGEISKIDLKTDNKNFNNGAKKVAFIEFKSKEGQQQAIALNYTSLFGHTIEVKEVPSKRPEVVRPKKHDKDWGYSR